ncbi:MAG TPA: hypothetical protein PKX15_00040 [Bacteroidales bacterium]|jgi:hypothetical protein|nr:hypothetical protein [Bacteroidales bacterium]
MRKLFILHITLFCLFTSLCIPEKKHSKPDNEMAIPPVIIYKTKKNYNKNVAVILSDDKSTILSYPDPKDVYRNGNYCYPTLLKKGYLLDNRGINKNVAFLSITYEEYAALKNPPSIDEMKKMIIDDNPLKCLFQCEKPIPNKNSIDELNLIIKKRCKQCTKIK